MTEKQKSILALKNKLSEYNTEDKDNLIEKLMEFCAVSYEEKIIGSNVKVFTITLKGIKDYA